MYKVLSNLKFMGKLYVKGDNVDLKKRLGEQLMTEGVVVLSKKTPAEVKKEEAERKRIEDAKKKEEEEKDKIEEYEDMNDEELINALETRKIDHKDLSREEAMKALEDSDKEDSN